MKLQKWGIALVAVLFAACSDNDGAPMPDPIPEGEALEITTLITEDNEGKFSTDVCVKGSNIVVDWGDGKREVVSSENHTTDFLHTYKKGGTYTIKIQKNVIRELILGDAIGTLPQELTISSCPLLEKLDISLQPNLSSFRAINCPKLTKVSAGLCPQLTELDLSGIPGLKSLECWACKRLSSLDVSSLTMLTYLRCSETSISRLDLSSNTMLERLILTSTPITTIDLKSQTALTELQLSQNQMENLNVTHNEQLSNLACVSNPIKNIDLIHNPNLVKFNCNGCQISTLDLSANKGLSLLACAENKLTTLDVSHNEHLVALSCRKNQLTELNMKNNTVINLIDCGENKMERDALETLFDALTDYTSKAVKGDLIPPRPQRMIAIQGNPGADRCAIQIFEKKGWIETGNLSNYIQ